MICAGTMGSGASLTSSMSPCGSRFPSTTSLFALASAAVKRKGGSRENVLKRRKKREEMRFGAAKVNLTEGSGKS